MMRHCWWRGVTRCRPLMQWCKEKKTEAGDCCKGPQLNVIWILLSSFWHRRPSLISIDLVTPGITGESEAAAGDNGHKALSPLVNMPSHIKTIMLKLRSQHYLKLCNRRRRRGVGRVAQIIVFEIVK